MRVKIQAGCPNFRWKK